MNSIFNFFLIIQACFTGWLELSSHYKQFESCLFLDLYMFLYYIALAIVFFMMSLVGGSVQNDAYKRLDQFVEIESKNKLKYAKAHPEEYDSMLRIDLKQFKDSEEFKAYLKQHDTFVDGRKHHHRMAFHAHIRTYHINYVCT